MILVQVEYLVQLNIWVIGSTVLIEWLYIFVYMAWQIIVNVLTVYKVVLCSYMLI
jgi:hypothetical protein